MAISKQQGRVRVIGVGNILLSDEGVGVHLVHELSRRGTFPGVEYLDGGTAGGGLMNLIEGEEKVVLLDTVAAPFPPGTVVRLAPDELRCDEGPRYSLHDLNLSDALVLMRLRETLPEVMILGIVPADIETYRIGLSDALAERFETILTKVTAQIERFAAAQGVAKEGTP